MRKKRKSIRNEVIINLLPERAKRDYILRLGAVLIVLIFLIVNFFTLLIPHINRLNQMNDLKREYTFVKSKYDHLQDFFNDFFHPNLYDLEKNRDFQTIEGTKFDLSKVVADIKQLLVSYEEDKFPYSEFTALERVSYDHEKLSLEIQALFLTKDQIIGPSDDAFIKKLQQLDYVAEIRFDHKLDIQEIPVQNSEPRFRVRVTIILDVKRMPKAGDADAV